MAPRRGVPVIYTNDEYKAALKELDTLMSAEPGTPEYERLQELSYEIEAYEEIRYPMGGTP